MQSAIIGAAKALITQSQQIAVIVHVDPDGDALGSLTAVGVALDQLGKKATLLCDDRVSQRFRYLPLADEIQNLVDVGVQYDLIMALDCGDEQRMGEVFANFPLPLPPVLNIDHHVTNTRFGKINLIEERAVSTTEILYQLFQAMDIHINEDLANCLLTGLVTDTLGFRTVGVTGTTLRIAGELVNAGADLSLITMQTLNLKPMATIHLWRAGLSNVRFSDGLIWSVINNKQRIASGHQSSSTAGLVNFLADMDQAAMSVVLLEMDDGSVRVGFRCRPPYNVAEVAMNLGGGGHALAAGCALPGPLAKVESLVVTLSKQAIQQQSQMLKNGRNR